MQKQIKKVCLSEAEFWILVIGIIWVVLGL
jgi:hypothetical protein